MARIPLFDEAAERAAQQRSPKQIQRAIATGPGYTDLVELLDRRLDEARLLYETTTPASEFLRARVLEIRTFRHFIISGDLE
jgi:hypothetical protein